MKRNSKPVVGVIMGSDSDLEIMAQAADVLEKFSVPCEVTIVSAHRTPDRLVKYCKSAESRGLRVIIAGAGGAAHLPGMAAALSPLPVIGVPIKSKNSIDGIDSLLSIVQMPREFLSQRSLSMQRSMQGCWQLKFLEFPTPNGLKKSKNIKAGYRRK